MLEKTFCHVEKVADRTERSLWEQGCSDWYTYLSDPERFSIGTADREVFDQTIRDSAEALAQGVHQYFTQNLPQRHVWRAWPQFRDRCAYLDIETDGGSTGDSVTMIGLWDGSEFICLLKNESLESFRDVVSRYSMLVTFFGTGFDIPMLNQAFRGLKFDQIHLDLCPTLRQLGLKGGLKKIEQQVGIARPESAAGLSGLDAIRLWSKWQHGDEQALATLTEYNRQDVVNLEKLAAFAYHRLSVQTLGHLLKART